MDTKELRGLIREEIKKVIASKASTVAKKKTGNITVKGSLKEGFAWERVPGKPLPTLKEVQAAYQAKLAEAGEDEPDEWEKPTNDGLNDLDNSKGGTDNSLNRAHSALLKLQKEMDKLLNDYKRGAITKDIYVAKRKPLQDKRAKLEAAL